MTRKFRMLVMVAVLAAIISMAFAGWLRPVDDLLGSYRFAFENKPASGDVVFVDIDTASLKAIGVWPWPRHIYAQLIDRLVADDASDIVFDVDFSTKSNEVDDTELERALRDAGGYVLLATFMQPQVGDAPPAINLPLPRFADNATLVSVNVPVDSDGIVRRYYPGRQQGDSFYPSIGAALSPGSDNPKGTFLLNYGIDVASIPHYSVTDILNGVIGRAQLSGKQIVVGASALELRDTFAVPRYGTLAGAMIHAVAAENLRQNIYLREAPIAANVLVAVLAALIAVLVTRVWGVLAAGLAAVIISAVSEGAALVLLLYFSITVETFVIHAAQLAVGVVILGFELVQKGILLDVASRAYIRTQNVLDRVISNNFDGIVVVDTQGLVISASRLAQEVLGRDEAPLMGREISDHVPIVLAQRLRNSISDPNTAADGKMAEIAIQTRDGRRRIIEYVITVSPPDQGARRRQEAGGVVCLTFRDVTERRANEDRLKYLASHDPLTGMLSRTRLVEIINIAMSDGPRRENGLTLFLLNLSRFKVINDSLGHSFGDAVLQQAAQRLNSADVSAVARLGADEFVMIRPGLSDRAETDAYCASILRRVSDFYQIGSHRAIVGAKIGFTTTQLSGFDPEVLLSHADMALSEAKRLPGNAFHSFEPAMERRLKETQDLQVAMRAAISLDQMFVTYQPQVTLNDECLTGVEALVRWDHPELGMISPAKFIPLAEESGLILEIGRWIMEVSCREVATWPDTIRLAVNVSPKQFEFGDVVGDVTRILAETGLAPERLDIEITEGMLISNPNLIITNLHKLRQIGVGIAIDDFGTGYSSLSYLGKLPVDKIKIDQSFVRDLPADQESAAIVRAIMTLSQSLGKTVVAEGIESAEQVQMLRDAGCHIGQGYYFGKPMYAAEVLERIAGAAGDNERVVG